MNDNERDSEYAAWRDNSASEDATISDAWDAAWEAALRSGLSESAGGVR